MRAFMAFFAALGFGIIFNIRGKNLFFAALNGMIGAITYTIITNFHNVYLGQFLSALMITLCAMIMARLLKAPLTTYLIAALIPLVPGGGMYYTMLYIVNNDLSSAISTGLDTIGQASMIVMGITFMSGLELAFNEWFKKRHHHL